MLLPIAGDVKNLAGGCVLSSLIKIIGYPEDAGEGLGLANVSTVVLNTCETVCTDAVLPVPRVGVLVSDK